MLNSILEDIMFGQFTVEDKIRFSKDYKKINEKCLKLYDELKSELSEKQEEKFDNFLNENMEVEYEESVAFFKAGFKLALRIAIECFSDN